MQPSDNYSPSTPHSPHSPLWDNGSDSSVALTLPRAAVNASGEAADEEKQSHAVAIVSRPRLVGPLDMERFKPFIPEMTDYLLEQSRLLCPEENVTKESVERWLRTRGIDLISKYRHSLVDQPNTEAGWENPNVHLQLTSLWLEDNFPDRRVRSQNMAELYPRGTDRQYIYNPDEEPYGEEKDDRGLLVRLWNAFAEGFPIRLWLPKYQKADFKFDFIAGLSTALNILPKGLAFAAIVGLPPVFGLYTAFIPPLVYSIFGNSPHLTLGPSLLVCLLTGAVARDWCGGSSDAVDVYYGKCTLMQYEQVVRKLAFIQGLVLFTLGVFKMGWLLRFFSRPLLTGFLAAGAVITLGTQLKFFIYNHDVSISDNPSLVRVLIDVAKHLGKFHGPTFLMSLLLFAMMVAFKLWKRTKHVYSILIVVISTLGTYVLLQIKDFDIYITGKITGGMPNPDIAFLYNESEGGDVSLGVGFGAWVTVSGAIALVGFMETNSAAAMCALQHGYKLDTNQDLVAVGMANIVGSIFQVMPTMGSLSATAMMTTFGGRTPLGPMIYAVIVGLMSFATSAFHYLPKPALALIVISAVYRLVDVKEMKFLWRGHRRDLWIMVTLLAFTLAFGIDTGLEAAIILNIVSHVYRSGNTESSELGRVPGSHHYASHSVNQAVYTYRNVVIFRFNGPIFFGNADRFKDRVLAYLDNPERISKGLIVDCTPVNFVDATGVHAIEEIARSFADKNLVLIFCGANAKVLTKIRHAGLIHEIGEDHFYDTIQDGLHSLLTSKIQVHQFSYQPGEESQHLEDNTAPKKKRDLFRICRGDDASSDLTASLTASSDSENYQSINIRSNE